MKTIEWLLLFAEVAIAAALASCLWYKVLLPGFYYLSMIILIALVIIQVALNRTSKILIVQIALIFLLTRSVFYLSTNYSIIPFGDGNFDYATAATFMQQGKAFIIDEPALLTTYSGWPLLHILAVSISSVSGLPLFYTAILLPYVFSISLFLFVYLIVEKVRKSLKFDSSLTFFALLIFAASPDSFFWPMQFVRQNMGLLFLAVTMFLIIQAVSNPAASKYKTLALFFALITVMTHHLSSLILALYLLLFSLLIVLGRYFDKTKIGMDSRSWPLRASLWSIGLAMIAFIFVWWDRFATNVWPFVATGIDRFLMMLEGLRAAEASPARAIYPAVLAPPLVTGLLLVRDLMLYLPAAIGFFLIYRRATRAPEKTFIVYSALAFGLIIIIDYFTTKIGTIRVIAMASPVLALLSGVLYFKIVEKAKKSWKVLLTALLVISLFVPLFIGLWGHNFAPVHLYNPAINPIDVGERNTDFMRIVDYNVNIPVENFSTVWGDDRNPLVFLLNPNDYPKIERMPYGYFALLGSHENELAYVLKDLNLYYYHAGVYSPIDDPAQVDGVRQELRQRLEDRFNRLFDDGKYEIWATFPLA